MGPPGNRGSWGPCVLPTLKAHPKKPIKGTRGISWGPLLTPGPRAVPECLNGQSAPGLERADSLCSCQIIVDQSAVSYILYHL
ncbi:unnamed protein product, partial [Staurois parvus]